MKTTMKSKAVLSGIFMATLSVLTGVLSTAKAVDNDPNLALPSSAAAAASQPMQATGPITIKTPSTAASAPRAAASAASAPIAPAVPAAVPADAKKVVATDLSDEEFKKYAFAFRNIDGISIDKTESPVANSRWRKSITVDALGVEKFVSNDQTMSADFFGPYSDGSSEVVAYNKNEGRATLTSFAAKKPVSYTVVGKRGEYTATPKFCKLLAFQTNSKDFAQLAESAVTCKNFYDKTNMDDSLKVAAQSDLQETRDAHRRNLAMLEKSVAKPLVDAALAREAKRLPQADGRAKSWLKNALNATVGANYQVNKTDNPLKTIKPRNVLTANGTPEEAEDRAVLFELAEACGKLWKDSDAEAPAATAKPAGGKATKK